MDRVFVTGTTPDLATEPVVRLRRWLVAASVVVLLGVLPFLSGLVGALILYGITRNIHERLARIVPRRVSAFAVAFAVVGLMLLAGTWLASTIVVEAGEAMRRWQPDEVLGWLARTPVGGSSITGDITSGVTAVLGWLSTRAVALVGSVTFMLLNLLIALFGLYYLLLDGHTLWPRVKRFLPVSDATADLLAARFAKVTDALMLGTALTAALQGILVGVGFAFAGLRPAVLWGFVTACVSVLPLFGSAIVWLPGVFVLLFDHRPTAALLLAVLGAGLASNIDNLVRPLVYRRVSGIHPMLTIVGAFAGVRLVGLIGAFVGPLVLSYFVELLGVYEDTTLLVEAIAPVGRPVASQHH